MEKDPAHVARRAAERQDENWRFRTFLKSSAQLNHARLDALAERLGRAAEAQMNCQTCAACCRDNWIPLSDEEIARLARARDLEVAAFRERFVAEDDDGEPAIDATPCPFLDGNTCTVYDQRPDACRGYPYLGGNVVSRTIGILERAGTCPIVFEMLEQLKDKTGFRQYGQR